jgi:drug/metabolite transporter (DMT)-like permease
MGFGGTMLIIRPSGGDLGWAALLPLGPVASNAAFQVITSRMARTENPLTMHFYTGWIGTLLSSLALPFVWAAHLPWGTWAAMLFMGLMGSLGHFMLISAMAAPRRPFSRPICMRRSASPCSAAG